MKASRFHIATLKEAPSDAEIVSHRLMTRAGMIRKLAGGIYNYMPMGLRVVRKIEAIVREEMVQAGAIELLMPVVQPAELWIESERWVKYGPELLRVKDRHGRDFVVQPTSEEVVTDIARNELRSYRQLPKNFFHIQTKFRDERRPRFGVMRGREFTMKDAYSFDRNHEAALASYRLMYDAYERIFERMGLRFRAVAADTGAIGGSASHEFQVIADTGEDAIAWCPGSDYAANVELAEALPASETRPPAAEALEKTPTPGRARCEDVAELLGLPLVRTVKSLVLAVDPAEGASVPAGEAGRHAATQSRDQAGQSAAAGTGAATAAAGTDGAAGAPGAASAAGKPEIWLLLVRGDHELNEVKAGKVPGLKGFRFASEAEIFEHFGCSPGYLGPIGLRQPVKIVANRTVANMADFVCGANEADFHYTGVNWGRDLPEPLIADIRNVQAGDPSPDGRGQLQIQRGIEVGHVFYLGTRYSESMNATFVDEDGRSRPFEMGCYGIGITRLAGAAIEQNHDERGIVWPGAIAPFEVAICPLGYRKSERVREVADALYAELAAAGIDVILDDRDERPGAMFADWELIGVPVRLTIGERSLKDDKVELLLRRDMQSLAVPVGESLPAVRRALAG